MTESIRVLVNGAKGRMGVEAVKAVQQAEDMNLIAALDRGDDLATALRDSTPDVVVDFTTPESCFKNAQMILDSKAGGVIGTTGFSPENIDALRQQTQNKQPGIIIAPNFSIGALLMMRCAEIAAKHMPHVEIIELHHEAKLDAPSGTAIKTAELIANAMPSETVSRETVDNPARGCFHRNIPIHSVRLPGHMAHQEVIFGGDGQTLRIRHDTLNRTCYMPGVLLAIRECVKRPGLTYGLETILFG